MGYKLNEFDASIRVEAKMDAPGVRDLLAETAIKARDEAIHAGEASAIYDTYVNGRLGADEHTVKLPGPIIYKFHYGSDIAVFALEKARSLSPEWTGAYRNAWFVLQNGAAIEPNEIDDKSPFAITNDRPYARKIQIGSKGFTDNKHIIQRVGIAVRSRWGEFVKTRTQFINLACGYVLRMHGGGQETYPALIIIPR